MSLVAVVSSASSPIHLAQLIELSMIYVDTSDTSLRRLVNPPSLPRLKAVAIQWGTSSEEEEVLNTTNLLRPFCDTLDVLSLDAHDELSLCLISSCSGTLVDLMVTDEVDLAAVPSGSSSPDVPTSVLSRLRPGAFLTSASQ